MERSGEFLDFMARTHGFDHPLTNQGVLEHFFLGKEGSSLTVSCLEIDGIIRGALGYIPTLFLWDFNRVEGVWTSVWFVEEEFRQGGGSLLLRKIMERFPIVGGHGASEDNQQIVGHLGHSFLPYIPKFVHVIRSFSFEGHRVRDTAGALELTHPWSAVQPTKFLRGAFAPVWEAYEELRFSTLRNAEYLRRNYEENPYFEYYIFETGQYSTPSIGIVRIIQIQGSIIGCRVLEIFGPSGADFQSQNFQLVHSMMAFARNQGCDYLECHTSSKIFGDVFSAFGFARDDLGLLPSLVSPLSRHRTGQNFELWVSPSISSVVCPSRDFYVTRGDGDQERPGSPELEEKDASR